MENLILVNCLLTPTRIKFAYIYFDVLSEFLLINRILEAELGHISTEHTNFNGSCTKNGISCKEIPSPSKLSAIKVANLGLCASEWIPLFSVHLRMDGPDMCWRLLCNQTFRLKWKRRTGEYRQKHELLRTSVLRHMGWVIPLHVESFNGNGEEILWHHDQLAVHSLSMSAQIYLHCACIYAYNNVENIREEENDVFCPFQE